MQYNTLFAAHEIYWQQAAYAHRISKLNLNYDHNLSGYSESKDIHPVLNYLYPHEKRRENDYTIAIQKVSECAFKVKTIVINQYASWSEYELKTNGEYHMIQREADILHWTMNALIDYNSKRVKLFDKIKLYYSNLSYKSDENSEDIECELASWKEFLRYTWEVEKNFLEHLKKGEVVNHLICLKILMADLDQVTNLKMKFIKSKLQWNKSEDYFEKHDERKRKKPIGTIEPSDIAEVQQILKKSKDDINNADISKNDIATVDAILNKINAEGMENKRFKDSEQTGSDAFVEIDPAKFNPQIKQLLASISDPNNHDQSDE